MKHLACILFTFSMASLVSSQGHAESQVYIFPQRCNDFILPVFPPMLWPHTSPSLWEAELLLVPMVYLELCLGSPRPFSTWSLSIYLQLVQQCHLQADFQAPVQMPHALHLWARSFVALCLLHSKLREGEEQWHRVTCVALAPGLGLNREEIYLRIPRISDGNYVTAPR